MSIAAPRVSTHTAKLVFVMGVNEQRVEFVSQPYHFTDGKIIESGIKKKMGNYSSGPNKDGWSRHRFLSRARSGPAHRYVQECYRSQSVTTHQSPPHR